MQYHPAEDFYGTVFSSAGRKAREEHAQRAKHGCKYPDCSNYKKGATGYCCAGCNCDHTDWLKARADRTPFQKVMDKLQEEDETLTIGYSHVLQAEGWFNLLESKTYRGNSYRVEAKALACLFNGFLLTADPREQKKLHRYEARPLRNPFSERDGKWCVVDTHKVSKWLGYEFEVVIHVEDRAFAERVTRAMNQYEGYAKAPKYVEPKPTRRKNG
jgi:hypothetical protein